jgi:hypothetical protein
VFLGDAADTERLAKHVDEHQVVIDDAMSTAGTERIPQTMLATLDPVAGRQMD